MFWQHMWHFVCFKRLTLLLTVPFALQRCDFLVLVTIVCLKRLIRMSILFQRLTYVCGHCLKRLSLCLFYCIYVYTLYIYMGCRMRLNRRWQANAPLEAHMSIAKSSKSQTHKEFTNCKEENHNVSTVHCKCTTCTCLQHTQVAATVASLIFLVSRSHG